MKGRLRIRDRTSEREVELSRGISYIGCPSNGELTVGSDVPDHSGLSLQWDPRHATWMLHVGFALSMPASVNGRAINPGQEIPLSNLATLGVADAMIQFQRVLAAPMGAGHATSRIALDSQPLVIG